MTHALNRVMWTTTDGHEYHSIPADIPKIWERREVSEDEGHFEYVCGEYAIERQRYGKRWTFFVTRQTVRIGLFEYTRLHEAKAAAEKNARGEEVRHVA